MRRLTFLKEDKGEIVPIKTPDNDLLEEETENEVAIRLPQVTVDARKLNKKQQDFAMMVAQGMPHGRAYALVGYGVTNAQSAAAAGSRLANRDHVAAYIRSLKEAIYEKDAMTIKEAKSKLSQIARLRGDQVTEDSEFVGVKINPDGTKTIEGPKVSDKINAIEKIGKMSGWLSDQTSINVGFNFAMLASDPEEMVVDTPVIEQ